jgi:hypothetical protein
MRHCLCDMWLYVICYTLYVICIQASSIGVLDACMHEVPVSCSAVPAVADSCVQHCVNSDVSVNVTSQRMRSVHTFVFVAYIICY